MHLSQMPFRQRGMTLHLRVSDPLVFLPFSLPGPFFWPRHRDRFLTSAQPPTWQSGANLWLNEIVYLFSQVRSFSIYYLS